MNFPGFDDAPGFDDPLGVLRACHGRIEAQCVTLERLHAHLPLHGCDAPARQAAQAVLRYFDTAGEHHHRDEEQDVFPMLRATGDSRVKALIEHLLATHVALDEAWAALRIVLADIAAGTLQQLEEGPVCALVAAYRQHIASENAELLPLAAQLLEHEQLAGLGRAMAARRGVAYRSASA